MARVKHYMVGTLSLTDYYSASNFEEDVVSLLSELHKTIPTVVMTGGSMMYIDAVCKGIDDIPTVTPEIRDALYMQFETEGLAPILAELKEADPVHYEEVDRNNYKRVIHAVEICRMTGKPYSSFRTNIKKERPFRIIKVGLNRDRDRYATASTNCLRSNDERRIIGRGSPGLSLPSFEFLEHGRL